MKWEYKTILVPAMGDKRMFVRLSLFLAAVASSVLFEAAFAVDAKPSKAPPGTIGFPFHATWENTPAFFAKEFERRGLPPTAGHGILLTEPLEDLGGFVAEGLRPEDIVIRLNGVHLKDHASYKEAAASLHSGKPAKAAIKRVNPENKEWKKNSGYHIRSLAETTMFRLKTIFGNELSARLLETQTTQALVRCAALNKMTHLGMPQSYMVV